MKFCYFLFLSFLIPLTSSSQVTFADDIASIIYDNCSNCHRPGEIGPFPLTNYDEIKDRALTIKSATETGYMPPWKPDTEYSKFIGESVLEQSDIDKIADWIDNGMERGDVANEPEFPDYPTGSLLGEPDWTVSMTEAHLHRGNNKDSYYYFVLPTDFPEDKIVKAVEFRPGNKKIVHHALIFEDNNGIAKEADQTISPNEYGFESFGSFNGDDNDITFLNEKQFPPYAPGQKAIRYPDGLGQVLKKGADLAVQIHYAPSASDELDQSSINFFFADDNEVVDRFVDQDIFLPLQLPGGFFNFIMRPNEVSEFIGTWTIPRDQSLMGIFPHSHLLGKEWEAWLEHTDGTITNLISIPDWDFNWQSQYYFDRFIKAEAGSVIKARAVYDNTTSNPNNPNNPPELVFWGDRTQDEMFYMPFLFVPYQQGDEDIIFDQMVSTDDVLADRNDYKLFPVTPNPVENYVTASFNMKKGGSVNVNIIDIQGNLVRQLRKNEYFHTGQHFLNFKAAELAEGMYLLNIQGKDFNLSEKFIKVK